MRIKLKGNGNETILEALRREGIVIDAPCGGRGICGKCRVRILEGRVIGERDDAGEVQACYAKPLGTVLVELPDSDVPNPHPTSPASGGGVTLAQRYGMALDIGTTTLEASLLNLESGASLERLSVLNNQRIYGADVMSRIAAAQRGRGDALFELINQQTASIIAGFQERHHIRAIERLSVAANTTMLHFFAHADATGLGTVPFRAAFLESRCIPGLDLGLSLERVELLPSLSAFIGADIIGGLTVSGAADSSDALLFLDLGTNAEMALVQKSGILCCSAAAGPALEGAEISCGSGGVPGAINKVQLNGGKTAFAVIGGIEPKSICGSGLVDAVAGMLDEGIIDETGAFQNGSGFFAIAPGLGLNQADIRKFQLAKGAIYAGIRLLCLRSGVKAEDIGRVILAGGLGTYLNPQSAVRSGLLPAELSGKIEALGNLSLKAAEKTLSESDFIARCEALKARCSCLELADDNDFMQEFTDAMIFPCV